MVLPTQAFSLVLLFGFVALFVSALRSYSDEYVSLGRWTYDDAQLARVDGANIGIPNADTMLSTARSGAKDSSVVDLVVSKQLPRRPFLARIGEAVQRRSRRRVNDNMSLDLAVDLYASSNTVHRIRPRLHHRHSSLLERLRSSSHQQSSQDDTATTSEDNNDALILRSITQPIISQAIWDKLSGTEFQQHPEQVDALAVMGEQLARSQESSDANQWIDWKAYGSQNSALQHGHIHVWTGKSKVEGYGSKSPWIKTQSIVPLSPEEMAELLLDSSRVQTYNPWSLGREDMWVDETSKTKIVKNRTQPPMGSKSMVSVTLIHARPLEDGVWLVVSRAVGGTAFQTEQDRTGGRSDILLGVNLLQPVSEDPESCLVTAITHVYSTAVPAMLAEQLGVKGAVKFVKDVRKLKVPASSS